ncbi:T9SS type A sorting domain-containing protein [Crocinitomix catalasitica]|uniref:T9SS type A sorting domain-containing protein n=1 Tax=Crocinitomix catalasitica TaxID=184607 RepID=UPI0004807D6D|nr:T9SS type A sorting domain-containing protein [Crocinitomix catalasitica]
MRNTIIAVMALFSAQLTAQNTLYNNGSFQMHTDAKLGCFGDFMNDGTMTENNGKLYLVGDSGGQLFSGSGSFIFDSVVVNTSDDIIIEQEFKIAKNVNFTSGNLITDRAAIVSEFVHFLAGSNYNGASDASFIDGVTVKTGNTEFEFPVGDLGEMRKLKISAPDLITDQFKAFYLNDDPDSIYSTLAVDLTCLDHVSRCEYWILNRTIGIADVTVDLNYDLTSCGVNDLCDLIVSRWDGTEWVSEGNGGVVGTITSGTITTGDGCGDCGLPEDVTEFSPFTIGSASPLNPLPIELIDFQVHQNEQSVDLKWETASEINSDYFEIERSNDGVLWQFIGELEGNGNSSRPKFYNLKDYYPLMGISYYRLTQVDYDGTKEEIGVRSVNFIRDGDYRVQPIPASTSIDIYYSEVLPTQIIIYESNGSFIRAVEVIPQDEFITVDIQDLPPGIYYIHIRENEALTVKKVVVI